MRDENFLGLFLEILADTQMVPAALEVELTEGVLMTHPEAPARTLQTLRDGASRWRPTTSGPVIPS